MATAPSPQAGRFRLSLRNNPTVTEDQRPAREEQPAEMLREPMMSMKEKQVSEELRESRWSALRIKLLKAKRLTIVLIGSDMEMAYAKMQGLPEMFVKTSEIQNRLGSNSPPTRDVQENKPLILNNP